MTSKNKKKITARTFIHDYFKLKNNWLFWLDLSVILFAVLFISYNNLLPEVISNVLFVILAISSLYLIVRLTMFFIMLALSFQGLDLAGNLEKVNQRKAKRLGLNTNTDSANMIDFITKQKVDSSLNWFTLVAVISIINALLILFKLNLEFMIGLGSIQWIGVISNALADKFGVIFLFIGFALSLSLAWFFYLVRQKGSKSKNWVYAGLALYGLDSLLFLPVKGYIQIGFHVFVMIMIFQYFRVTKLDKVAQSNS